MSMEAYIPVEGHFRKTRLDSNKRESGSTNTKSNIGDDDEVATGSVFGVESLFHHQLPQTGLVCISSGRVLVLRMVDLDYVLEKHPPPAAFIGMHMSKRTLQDDITRQITVRTSEAVEAAVVRQEAATALQIRTLETTITTLRESERKLEREASARERKAVTAAAEAKEKADDDVITIQVERFEIVRPKGRLRG